MPYSSDLTDDQWDLLEPVFNAPGKRGRKHGDDLRVVVDAMLYVAHTGCQWRYLPESFGPWTRVLSQFRRWSRNGTWARTLAVLHAAIREADGRTEATPSMVVIDTYLTRGASNGGFTFHDRGGPYGRTKGAKRVVAVGGWSWLTVGSRPLLPAFLADATTLRSVGLGGTTSSRSSSPSGTLGASRSPTGASDAPVAWQGRSRTRPRRRPAGSRSPASRPHCVICHSDRLAGPQWSSQHENPADERRGMLLSQGLGAAHERLASFDRGVGARLLAVPTTRRNVIQPYSEKWPSEFVVVKDLLQQALGDVAERIDHIGSTSVPGLAAKAIIDVQISVADLNDARLGPAFAQLGATPTDITSDHVPPGGHRGTAEWEKRYFRPPASWRRTHLHVRATGRSNFRYALLFRDYLRHSQAAAAAYAQVKLALSRLHPDDLDAYYTVKDPVCDLIMDAAERWATEAEWSP